MADTINVDDIASEQELDETVSIEDILAGEDIQTIVSALKTGRINELPDMDKIRNEWEPSLHKTMTDKSLLPDRTVNTGEKDTDGNDVFRFQKVNRLSLPLQKKIVNTAVSFTFGNPVELKADVEDGSMEEEVLNALNRLSHDCKLQSFNRSAFRDLLRCTEVAEYWYPVKLPDNTTYSAYGFDSKFKIRVASFSPWNGDKLFPFFDHTGDMVAFSREYTRKDKANKEVIYFEVYTAERHIIWANEGTWRKIKDVKLPFGKIPIVYVSQEAVEWVDLQVCIERLEFLLSKFAETNDYHASPKIFVNGKITGFAEKGESGAILQGDKDAKAEYLSWDHAPESVKLEIETLIRFIYGQTQTPDISFDSVKGLRQVSGEALKMLFMDAHLKVEEKREILDSFLQRRVNIQKAIMGTINSAWKQAAEMVQIEPEIIPWIIDDETTRISNLVTANGGKPIISQKTSIRLLGKVDDVDEELQQIRAEEKESKSADVFESTE